MDIPSVLKKPIYVAYAIGSIDGKIEYSEPTLIYAQTENVNLSVIRSDLGIVPNYDRTILIPYTEKSQFIDEQTLIWVEVEPNATKSNCDYKIERVGDVIDNNFIIYCKSATPNTKSLYYEYNNKIYQVKVDLDKDNLTAIVPFNKFLAINTNTKVWLTKPTSNNSTVNLIKLVSKERLQKSYKFTFEKV